MLLMKHKSFVKKSSRHGNNRLIQIHILIPYFFCIMYIGGTNMDFLENSLKTSQKLLITPKMEQSLKILQMNSADLAIHLGQISMENPLIELYEDQEFIYDKKSLNDKVEWLMQFDEENKYLYHSDFNNNEFTSQIVREYSSLEMYLSNQLNTMRISPDELKAGKYIIRCLDLNGYLNVEIQEIAEKLSMKPDFIEKVLVNVIQAMDPGGVGARNLSECLMIQLERKGVYNENLKKIVYDDLILVAENKLNDIAKKYNISIEDTVYYCGLIKSLVPKPGSSFNEETIEFIAPDIIVNQNGDALELELNETITPKIYINHLYKKELLMKNDRSVNEFVTKKVKQAIWIYKCVNQRKETILKIGEKIVENQYSFFIYGPGNLVPMVLSDIANELSIHESTVSRAISDKWLQCSWGVFNLKSFFTSSIKEISSDEFKSKIKKIIDEEDKLKPLSDQKITDIFNSKDIQISRRTVAKYREEMNIPNTSGRKQYL